MCINIVFRFFFFFFFLHKSDFTANLNFYSLCICDFLNSHNVKGVKECNVGQNHFYVPKFDVLYVLQ